MLLFFILVSIWWNFLEGIKIWKLACLENEEGDSLVELFTIDIVFICSDETWVTRNKGSEGKEKWEDVVLIGEVIGKSYDVVNKGTR